MSRFTKVLVIIAAILAAMLFLTLTTPAIREFAAGLSKQSNLPIWLVGLAAPILFLFDRIGGFFRFLFGAGSTERSIRDTNDQIKAKLDDVEQRVQRLDTWRRNEIEPRLQRIDALQTSVTGMEDRAGALAAGLPDLVAQQAALRDERDQLQRQLDEVRRAIHNP